MIKGNLKELLIMKKRLTICSIITLALILSGCNFTINIFGSSKNDYSYSEYESIINSSSEIITPSSSGDISSFLSSESLISSSNNQSSNYSSSEAFSSGDISSSKEIISSSNPIESSSMPISSSSEPISSSNPISSSSTPISSTPVEGKKVTLDIFAVNDTHGNVKDTPDKGLGLAKSTTLLKELAKDKNSIFISQGDMWQGSVESNFTRGKLVTEWMNSLNFVSMTVGNHEFDWGQEIIKQNQQIANFPSLGINVFKNNTTTRVDYLSPSTTFYRGEAKIGVIGAIGNCLSSISSSKVQDIYFAKDNVLTNLVKQESLRLRNEENCDFIIYSVHGSATRDEDDTYDISLSNDHYVDLVLEGHTHTNYAELDEGGVYHVQCNGNNENIYQITVDLDLTNDTIKVNTPVSYDLSYQYSPYKYYEEDQETNDIINKYYDDYSFAYSTVGTVSEFKDPNTLRNKLADLYLEKGLEKWGSNYDIILGGGYMSCRGSGLGPGLVTYSDLNNLFPFDNDVVLCSIKGSDLRETQYITGSPYYFVNWTSYGETVKNNIDDTATYYLVTDTYGSDYKYNHLTVVDTLVIGGVYARDLLAEYISNDNWYIPPTPVTEHEGTVSDPKSISEALQLAEQYPGSNVATAGAVGYFFIGQVSNQAAKISDSTGDMNNLYVKDPETNEQILIYYISRNQYRDPNWSSVDDLKVGDTIIFYGKPFYYNSYLKEIGSGAYVYSINDVPTY